jgi:hypothetical protein
MTEQAMSSSWYQRERAKAIQREVTNLRRFVKVGHHNYLDAIDRKADEIIAQVNRELGDDKYDRR